MKRLPRIVASSSIAIAIAATCGPLAAEAWAAPPAPTGADAEAAERAYARGLRLLQEGNPTEALHALDASASVLPSPNTELLRGHALRSLERRVEAMAAYERVVKDAGELARQGDKRFEDALADAGTWIAVLKTSLGELTVDVRSPGEDFVLTIGTANVAVERDASKVGGRTRVWREPGTVHVEAKSASGRRASADVTIGAGSTPSLTLDLTERAHIPPAASFVAWSIGVAGTVVLAVAGSLAGAAMSELDACTPRCSEDAVEDARTKATIANIGIAVAAAGALAGGAIWLGVELTRPSVDAKANAAAVRGALVIGVTSAEIVVSFD